ncbi:MAG TPA: hypothetical protein VFY20_10470 [Gemmatimonadales bacterium]|nr:hypothetical protein [Gemmatimonadales bacterium]
MAAASDPDGKEALMFASRTWRTLPAIAAALLLACDNAPSATEGLEQDKSLRLSVIPGTLNVLAGTGGSGIAVVTRGDALTEPVQLSVSDVPAGVTVTFVPQSLPHTVDSAKIDVAVAEGVVPGTYPMTVHATAVGTATVARPFTLAVVPPPVGGFGVIPAGGILTVDRGAAPTTVTLTISRTAPFTGAVSFAVEGLPTGFAATVTPASTSGETVTLAVSAPADMAPGDYAFDLRMTADGVAELIHRWSVRVPVAPEAALHLTFDPAAVTIVAGGPGATATLNIERINFTGTVAIWDMTFDPIGMTLSSDHVETATSITVTVQAPITTAAGVYQARILGWAVDWGEPASGATLAVTVVAAQ